MFVRDALHSMDSDTDSWDERKHVALYIANLGSDRVRCKSCDVVFSTLHHIAVNHCAGLLYLDAHDVTATINNVDYYNKAAVDKAGTWTLVHCEYSLHSQGHRYLSSLPTQCTIYCFQHRGVSHDVACT